MLKIPPLEKWLSPSASFNVELVYSDEKHPYNIFVTDAQETAYITHADFIVSRPIALILSHVEKFLPPAMTLRVYDCLRPIEAQAFMKQFKDSLNIEHNMLSDPGMGGHPRAMAIDCALVPMNAAYGVCATDYGTAFDDLNFIMLDDGSKIAQSHRNNLKSISFMAKQNRLHLEVIMQKAALAAKIPLMPLPQEWWDFRLPKNTNDYGHILASFNRILLGRYEPSPEIKSYGEFYDYWIKYFDYFYVPNEKRHIFDGVPQVPSEQDFVFYENYSPVNEAFLHTIGLQVTEKLEKN
jgi:zinc D-Ala-D-Ala dipeptidase